MSAPKTRRVRVTVDMVLLLDSEVASVPIGGDIVGPIETAVAQAAMASMRKRGSRATVVAAMGGGRFDMRLDCRKLSPKHESEIAAFDAQEATERADAARAKAQA